MDVIYAILGFMVIIYGGISETISKDALAICQMIYIMMLLLSWQITKIGRGKNE